MQIALAQPQPTLPPVVLTTAERPAVGQRQGSGGARDGLAVYREQSGQQGRRPAPRDEAQISPEGRREAANSASDAAEDSTGEAAGESARRGAEKRSLVPRALTAQYRNLARRGIAAYQSVNTAFLPQQGALAGAVDLFV